MRDMYRVRALGVRNDFFCFLWLLLYGRFSFWSNLRNAVHAGVGSLY